MHYIPTYYYTLIYKHDNLILKNTNIPYIPTYKHDNLLLKYTKVPQISIYNCISIYKDDKLIVNIYQYTLQTKIQSHTNI